MPSFMFFFFLALVLALFFRSWSGNGADLSGIIVPVQVLSVKVLVLQGKRIVITGGIPSNSFSRLLLNLRWIWHRCGNGKSSL
jgi:hypothetical protein